MSDTNNNEYMVNNECMVNRCTECPATDILKGFLDDELRLMKKKRLNLIIGKVLIGPS